MKIRFLRKGSKGLEGTFRNAHCHAHPAVPLVHAAVVVIYSLEDHIEEWAQGHNIHMLKAKDGRWFSLRPYHAGNDWGIELKAHISRKVEFPIMTFDTWEKMSDFRVVLENALRVKPNSYQQIRKQSQEVAREINEDYIQAEYEQRFMTAESSTDYYNFEEKDDHKRNWEEVHAEKMKSYGYLRCPACKGKMSYHEDPTPHFEHEIVMHPTCPLYKRD